ncbi:hypothetical protein BDW22DRAFT_965416 [Trametopsis cervina]|nr:hypothetical protein BDW22DRAFT_965416 [Trametopsis cervina]
MRMLAHLMSFRTPASCRGIALLLLNGTLFVRAAYNLCPPFGHFISIARISLSVEGVSTFGSFNKSPINACYSIHYETTLLAAGRTRSPRISEAVSAPTFSKTTDPRMFSACSGVRLQAVREVRTSWTQYSRCPGT